MIYNMFFYSSAFEAEKAAEAEKADDISPLKRVTGASVVPYPLEKCSVLLREEGKSWRYLIFPLVNGNKTNSSQPLSNFIFQAIYGLDFNRRLKFQKIFSPVNRKVLFLKTKLPKGQYYYYGDSTVSIAENLIEPESITFLCFNFETYKSHLVNVKYEDMPKFLAHLSGDWETFANEICESSRNELRVTLDQLEERP